MTLTNRDASTITLKKKQKALFAWKSGNDPLVNVGASRLREQANTATLDVVTDRKQGGCKCSDDASSNPYANLR
jgi:hypothetical protein